MGNVVFLGVEGSGKTSLAMAFLNAIKRHHKEGWYLAPKSRDSFAFTSMLPADFALEGFPHETTSSKQLAWTLEYKGRAVQDLIFFDYKGELLRQAFLESQLDQDKDAFKEKLEAVRPEIQNLLKTVDGAERVFVLLNLSDAVDLKHNVRNIDAVWVTNECLKFVEQLPGKPAVTLLLSQVDKYGDLNKLRGFDIQDIALIAHDHPKVEKRFVSVLLPPDGPVGVDNVVRIAVGPNILKTFDEEIKLCKSAIDRDAWIVAARSVFSGRDASGFGTDMNAVGVLRTWLDVQKSSAGKMPWLLDGILEGSVQDVMLLPAAEVLAIEDLCSVLGDLNIENIPVYSEWESRLREARERVRDFGFAAELCEVFEASLRDMIANAKTAVEERGKKMRDSWKSYFDSLGDSDLACRTAKDWKSVVNLLKALREEIVAYLPCYKAVFGVPSDLCSDLGTLESFLVDAERQTSDLESLFGMLLDKYRGCEHWIAKRLVDYMNRSVIALQHDRQEVPLRQSVKGDSAAGRRGLHPSALIAFGIAVILFVLLKVSLSAPPSSAVAIVRLNGSVVQRAIVSVNGAVRKGPEIQISGTKGESVGPIEVTCKDGDRYYRKSFKPIKVDWDGRRESRFSFLLTDLDEIDRSRVTPTQASALH